MNFLIAVLSDTYSTYNSKSNALFLSKILSTRDEMTYEPSYGAFIAQIPPLNLAALPLVPFAMMCKQNSKEAERINELAMKIQYTLFIVFIFAIYSAISVALIPFGWVVGIADKIATMNECTSFKDKLMNKMIFIPFGLFILAANLVIDMIYFWINNFTPSNELKQIIIESESNNVNH